MQDIIARAKANKQRIVLPEGTEERTLKAADRLSALIKCIEESQGGNHEFEAARQQQLDALHAMDCPEAEYFIQHMLPCYAQNLDELTQGRF